LQDYDQHAQTLSNVTRQLNKHHGNEDIRSLMSKNPFDEAMLSIDDDNNNNGIDDDDNMIDEDDNNINNDENEIDDNDNEIDAVTVEINIINVNDDDNSQAENSEYLVPTETYNITTKNVTPIS